MMSGEVAQCQFNNDNNMVLIKLPIYAGYDNTEISNALLARQLGSTQQAFVEWANKKFEGPKLEDLVDEWARLGGL